MLKKWIALLASTALVLAACHSPVYNQTQGNVADVKIQAAQARHKSDNDVKPLPPLVVNSGSYVDTTPISLDKEPGWLRNPIVIRGDQLPFSYYSRTIASGAGSSILTKYQIGLDPALAVSVSYSGTVKGALDLIAAKSGYVYSVHRNTIYWQAFITRTFDVAFMPGASDYLMGKKGAGTTSSGASGQGIAGGMAQVQNFTTGDSSDSEYSNLSGKLSVWDDVNATIKQLLSADGRVTVSQATTSVTVRDKPTNVQLIADYIANLNNKLSRQVLVKVQVLEITLENDFTFGINWNLIANAFHNSPFVVKANYGTPVSITTFASQVGAVPGVTSLPTFGTLGDGSIPSYTILFNALNQQGKTSIVSEPRVVCLNNQVSVIRIVNQQGYLASVQNTTLASGTGSTNLGTVTSQLTPGTIVTGLTLYILPKILQSNIYLQVNADLSTAFPFTTVSSGDGTSNSSASIQVPNIAEKHFNQRSMIKSGDTLILSGFRQTKNIANANQFVTAQSLGGKGSQMVNTETVVLITPIILPGSA